MNEDFEPKINPEEIDSVDEDGTRMIGEIGEEGMSLEDLKAQYEETEDGPAKDALADLIRQREILEEAEGEEEDEEVK